MDRDSQWLPHPRDVPASEENISVLESSVSVLQPARIGAGWISIKDFNVTSGAKAPFAIRFPSGSEKPLKTWKQVLVEVAEWLIQNNFLTGPKCPIGRGYGRHIVDLRSQHPNGKDFFQPAKLSNGLFLETHVSARKAVDDARFLVEQLGQDASALEFRTT